MPTYWPMSLLSSSPTAERLHQVSTSTAPDVRPNQPSTRQPSTRPPSLRTRRRSDRVKLRRGLTFLGMTLVLPGSAQVAAGNRRIGRLALRIWGGLWAVAIVAGIFALLWPSGAVTVFTFTPVLRGIQVLVIVGGIGWILLLLDAWRISQPPDLGRWYRLGFTLVNLIVIGGIVAGLVVSASVVSAQRDLVSTVFAGGGDQVVKKGRYNILLMGGDAGKDRVGLRPDSMTVASVDAETGRTVLVGLPRNMERVPFPEQSPLHKAFPKGFYCRDRSCMLNAVYTYAMNHRRLYPGVKNPGAQATKEAIEGATGLQINYWVLVDLKGFQALVDAVGGITMDVYRRVPIGGGTAKLYGYVEAGRNRHLDGREALWFARSRSDSSDYDRMVRQKCVMNAMLNQLDPFTVLTNFNKIAAAGKEILATDIPTSDIDTMLSLALAAKKQKVSSVNLVPPLINTAKPDFALVRNTVATKIAAAEAVDPTSQTAQPTASQSGATMATPKPTRRPSAASSRGPEADDLTRVCAA
jgi:LCP family protein required for cell wall assembly